MVLLSQLTEFWKLLKPYFQPENDIAIVIVWVQITIAVIWFLGWLIFRFGYLRKRIKEIENCQNVKPLHQAILQETTKTKLDEQSDAEQKSYRVSPTTVFDTFCATKSISNKSPIEDHLRAIFDAGCKRRTPESEALIKATTNRVLRFHPIFRSVLSLFIILGLFGTLFGLASSLAQLAPITGQSFQSGTAIVGDSLQNLLEQLKSAFAPSIWGVLFTIIGVLIFVWSSYRATHFRQRLEFSTLTIWIPQLTPPAVDALTETILENEQQLRRNLETAEKNIQTAAELAKYVESIRAEITAFQKSFTDAKETLNEFTGAADKLTSVSGKFEKAAEKVGNFETKLSTLYEQLLKDSSDFQDKVIFSIEKTDKAQKTLDEQLKSENRSLSQILEKISAFEEKHRESNNELNENLKALSNELKKLTSEANTAFEGLKDRNKEIAASLAKEVGAPLNEKIGENLGVIGEKLVIAGEKFEKVETTLDVKLRDLVNWTQNLEKPFTKVADQLSKSFANFDNRTSQLTKEVKNEFIKINQTHEDKLNTLTLLNPEIGQLLKQLSESGATYNDQGKELTKLIEALASSVVSLSENVGELSQKIDRMPRQSSYSRNYERTNNDQSQESATTITPPSTRLQNYTPPPTRWQKLKKKVLFWK